MKGEKFPRKAFRNPKGETARRLGVLAAKVLNVETMFEAFAGGGSRTLLYASHLWPKLKLLHANEGNRGFLCELLYDYLSKGLPTHILRLSVRDFATDWSFFVCNHEPYDWVDLDPFGSPSPFLIGALSLTKVNGYLYITATDTPTLAGRRPGDSVRLYNIHIPPWDTYGEVGARALTYYVWSIANSFGKHITPLFLYYEKYAYRLLIRLGDKRDARNIGYIQRCKECGQYLKSSKPLAVCLKCGGENEIFGPTWVGPLKKKEVLTIMEEEAHIIGWNEVARTLRWLRQEIDVPMFYSLSSLKLHRMPSVREVVRILREAGFEASRTQFDPTGIKTDASPLEFLPLLF
ncbi:MAG: hypothetical protein GXO39_02955 [Thermotogae bacterium]|nr:hypothetical protein [Thermotogota bacterium]